LATPLLANYYVDNVHAEFVWQSSRLRAVFARNFPPKATDAGLQTGYRLSV